MSFFQFAFLAKQNEDKTGTIVRTLHLLHYLWMGVISLAIYLSLASLSSNTLAYWALGLVTKKMKCCEYNNRIPGPLLSQFQVSHSWFHLKKTLWYIASLQSGWKIVPLRFLINHELSTFLDKLNCHLDNTHLSPEKFDQWSNLWLTPKPFHSNAQSLTLSPFLSLSLSLSLSLLFLHNVCTFNIGYIRCVFFKCIIIE
jgi:hypothetical protein